MNNNRTIVKSIPCLLFLTAVFTLLTISCSSTKVFAGVWNHVWIGEIDDEANPPSFTLDLRDVDSSKAEFGSPYNCTIVFEYPAMDTENDFSVSVDSADGGRCDDMWNGKLRISKSNDGTIRFRFEKDLRTNEDLIWLLGTLKKQDE